MPDITSIQHTILNKKRKKSTEGMPILSKQFRKYTRILADISMGGGTLQNDSKINFEELILENKKIFLKNNLL